MGEVSYFFALEVDESDAVLINVGNCQISIINPTHPISRIISNVAK
jgi:hypothetical protein